MTVLSELDLLARRKLVGDAILLERASHVLIARFPATHPDRDNILAAAGLLMRQAHRLRCQGESDE